MFWHLSGLILGTLTSSSMKCLKHSFQWVISKIGSHSNSGIPIIILGWNRFERSIFSMVFTNRRFSPYANFITAIFQYIVWIHLNVTKVISKIYGWKVQKLCLFFYLHFTWLYGSWHPQRILKKYPFWKYASCFFLRCQT